MANPIGSTRCSSAPTASDVRPTFPVFQWISGSTRTMCSIGGGHILSRQMPRLDRLLARNLGLSRAVARRLLDAGAVRGGGGALVEGGAEVAAGAVVEVEGRTVRLLDAAHVLLHKPTGTVTALRDARHPT